MLSNGSEPTNTAYFRPALGGDMAVMRGIAKFLLLWEREAQAKGEPAVFDHAFIEAHTSGVDAYLAVPMPRPGTYRRAVRPEPGRNRAGRTHVPQG